MYIHGLYITAFTIIYINPLGITGNVCQIISIVFPKKALFFVLSFIIWSALMFHFYVSQNSNRYCRNEIVRSNLGMKSISPALSTVSVYVHWAEADSGNRSWSSPGSDKSISLKKSFTHINTQNIKWGYIRRWNQQNNE